jgi:hypothetical protein
MPGFVTLPGFGTLPGFVALLPGLVPGVDAPGALGAPGALDAPGAPEAVPPPPGAAARVTGIAAPRTLAIATVATDIRITRLLRIRFPEKIRLGR